MKILTQNKLWTKILNQSVKILRQFSFKMKFLTQMMKILRQFLSKLDENFIATEIFNSFFEDDLV